MQDIIVMNQVSARDLTTISKERERKQREVFVVVLERVYSRIKRCASVGMYTCHFEIPEVVFGYPMFDIERCIRFSMRHLVMNGFEVSRVNATKTMDISWLPHDKSKASFRHEIRPNTVNLPSSTTQKQFRGTSSRDVRPIPSVVHGDNDLILSIKRRPIESQQPFRCIDSFVPHNIFPSR